MALIDRWLRSATVSARTECRLVPLDETKFMQHVHRTPFFALQVMRILALCTARAPRVETPRLSGETGSSRLMKPIVSATLVGTLTRCGYDKRMYGRRRLFISYILVLLSLLLPACGQIGPQWLPDVLFVRPGAAGRAQLFRQNNATGAADQLSAQPSGDVLDFASSPDGRQIAYSVSREGGGSIRIVNSDGTDDTELLPCPQAECSGLVWQPDGQRLIYERRPITNGVAGSPILYWLDPGIGNTLPLLADEDTPGYGVRFSPDGQWLSYVSPADEGVVLYHLADGEQRLLSSRVGRPAAFAPDSRAIVIGDLVLTAHDVAPDSGEGSGPLQESSSVYLYLVTLGQEGRERLSPELAVDDSAPAWSPDGQWIAFGRAPGDTAAGRQLWLMRRDGSEARALTNDPAFFHGPPAWSPDGSTLLYQRVDLSDPAAMPEVWQLRLSDGQQTLVAESGYLPAWLP